MANKMVKPNEKLNITSFGNDMEFNVTYHAQSNNIFFRITTDDEMRQIACQIASAIENNTLVREDLQNKLIKWVTENRVGTYYFITIQLYTEPNYNGNMNQYYVREWTQKKVSLCGPDLRKRYVSRAAAIKAASNMHKTYMGMDIHYKNSHRIFVYEQTLHDVTPRVISQFEDTY